jgi:PIN domain nuclease of toxin-antitoxin system
MVIWAIDDSGRLPSHVRLLLDDPNERTFVSSVTFAEMAIKMS